MCFVWLYNCATDSSRSRSIATHAAQFDSGLALEVGLARVIVYTQKLQLLFRTIQKKTKTESCCQCTLAMSPAFSRERSFHSIPPNWRKCALLRCGGGWRQWFDGCFHHEMRLIICKVKVSWPTTFTIERWSIEIHI